MKSIELTEKKYFDFNPNFKFGFYLSVIIGIALIIIGSLFKEWIIAFLGIILLALNYKNFANLYHTIKKASEKLIIQAIDGKLVFKYQSTEATADIEKLDMLLINIDPQESKKLKKYTYKIFCQCGKKTKELLKIPASLLAGGNLDLLRDFIKKVNSKIDIIAVSPQELY